MNKVNQVVVIGAGPVGMAAAAHLLEKGQKPLVLEKGASAGNAMQFWGHVQVFTPWKYVVDKAVVALLEKSGWTLPEQERLPTAQEIVDEYLIPAASTPELKSVITFGAEVLAVSKDSHSKHTSTDRDKALFTVHYRNAEGEAHIIQADAVIDASGTWSNPNPMGLDGLPVPGEVENQDAVAYGIPDVLNRERASYEGKRTLVLGAGHSAINVALDLMKLQKSSSKTRITWGLRKNNIEKLLGGGINDELPARGELGLAAKKAIDSGSLELITQIRIKRIVQSNTGLTVQYENDGVESFTEVDRIVVTTGFRPDLNMLRELRLDIDHIVEAPSALAPLIDPNLHSCGTVKPHGVDELSHHDKNFFIVGMKAYGRAPTFLMLTGYEQVRSIAAELAGDKDAARRVELVLPETGVCNSSSASSGTSCCAPEPKTSGSASSCCAPKPRLKQTVSCCG
ncbi:NAD(P)-binding domain-containing protein [Endozoicomonas arenosclerae]|uniref:NAD(P)-binding domain-containing protein n=1 Tax=Endozoicomonas arenosclerae TaxID=1633495 RepID=UPI000785A1E4|nr:NAD(P)-binding domain-containing protein [Endozoicomonas arenosclerae]